MVQFFFKAFVYLLKMGIELEHPIFIGKTSNYKWSMASIAMWKNDQSVSHKLNPQTMAKLTYIVHLVSFFFLMRAYCYIDSLR
jgi:hypothetical protein